jgi:hypothetical protein
VHDNDFGFFKRISLNFALFDISYLRKGASESPLDRLDPMARTYCFLVALVFHDHEGLVGVSRT